LISYSKCLSEGKGDQTVIKRNKDMKYNDLLAIVSEGKGEPSVITRTKVIILLRGQKLRGRLLSLQVSFEGKGEPVIRE
jgi:hypothetical protein